MIQCDVVYMTYDFMKRRCMREKDHRGPCNAFSNTMPMGWEEAAMDKPVKVEATPIVGIVEEHPAKPGEQQCFYCDAHSRCILKFRHTGNHRTLISHEDVA